MTTPANDETKKDKVTTSAGGTTPKTTDAKDTSVAPKKRKRKRKPKKVVVSETSGDKEIKTEPSSHTLKKHEHEEKEKTKKEEKTEENKKPNLDIKSDAHMLPGIDNIHDYIARKKATTHAQHKKEVLTSGSYVTPEGIDLLTLPGLFALIPHAKGDHKLVYLRTNEPTGLIDDPRKRTPGSMYVKNGRDIYMVTLTMKEHATLKDAHGESYDVWIIDTLEQLTAQLDAIKNGMGGGENFGEPIFIEQGTEQPIDSNQLPVAAIIGTDTLKTQSAQEVISIPQVTNIPNEAESNTVITDMTQEGVGVEPTEPVSSVGEQDDISPVAINPEETTSLDLPDIDPEVTTDIGNIDSIDLTLPVDEDIPDSALDIPEDLRSVEDTPSEEKEPETNSEEPAGVSLDGIDATEEQEGKFSVPETTEDIISSPTEDTTPEQITLDMEKEASLPEVDAGSTLHFTAPETGIADEEKPTEPLPEEPTSHALFGAVYEDNTTPVTTDSNELTSEITEQISEKSMFSSPSFSPYQETNADTESTLSDHQNDTPTEPMFSSQVTSSMTNEPTLPKPEIQPETPLASEPIQPQQESGLDLDDLHIESADGTLDLDAMAQGNQPEEAIVSSTATASTSTHTTPKKSSFPIAIVIRIVLFLLIVGALFLVWKVMFPTIKGTKAPESNTPTTEQQINDTSGAVDTEPQDDTTNPIDDTDITEPQDDAEPIDNTDIPTTDDEINQPIDTTNNDTPTGDTSSSPADDTSLTLSELEEKLKVQQTDARKVLNIAKLLENKQAIKFALAAMLKAGNVLERIDTETTITAQDVLQESQKIDAYLHEANKLVE